MNKRIKNKKIKQKNKLILNESLLKFKNKYNIFALKYTNYYVKFKIIGLEKWIFKISVWDCTKKKLYILGHYEDLIDSFKHGECYIEEYSIDENLFKIIDNIILREKFHIGCIWGGSSNIEEECIEKYNNYINELKISDTQSKLIKERMKKYLISIKSEKYVKDIFITKGRYSYKDSYGIFVSVYSNTPIENMHELERELKNEIYYDKDEKYRYDFIAGKPIEFDFWGVYKTKKYIKHLNKNCLFKI